MSKQSSPLHTAQQRPPALLSTADADAAIIHWNDVAASHAAGTHALLEQLAVTDAALHEAAARVRSHATRRRAEAVYQLLMHVRRRVQERQHDYENELKTYDLLL